MGMEERDYVGKAIGTRCPAPHYYGDTVRKLFLTGGILMLVTLPFLYKFTPVHAIISVLIILVMGFLAGLENPTQYWVNIAAVVIAALALSFFEYNAISGYVERYARSKKSLDLLFFVVNQALALIFFFALYYASKTVRGEYVKDDRT